MLDLDRQDRAVARDGLPEPGRSRRRLVTRQPVGGVSRPQRAGRSATSMPFPPPAARAGRSSALPNGNANNISWSPDGTYILYNTSQRTEEGQVVRVDLILRTPKFREDRFRDLFKEEPTPARAGPRRGGARRRDAEPARDPSTPVDIVFDDIRRRLSLLPVGVDVAAQTISPDGRSLLLTATAEGQQNLYLYSLDELAREPAVARQLTSTAGRQGRRAVHARQPRDLLPRTGAHHGDAGRDPCRRGRSRSPPSSTSTSRRRRWRSSARRGPTCATASTTTSSTA